MRLRLSVAACVHGINAYVLDYRFSAEAACGFDKHEPPGFFEYCCSPQSDRKDLAEVLCWREANNNTPRATSPYRKDFCCDQTISIKISNCEPQLEILKTPSQQEPLVFLHHPRTGGTTLEKYLGNSSRKLGVQHIISAEGWNVVGTPFFTKFYPPEVRRTAAVVSGHYDWDIIGSDVLSCKQRALRCIVLLRHPVERFISYYARRGLALGNSWATLREHQLRKMLELTKRGIAGIRVEEGVTCAKSIGLCLDDQMDSKHLT